VRHGARAPSSDSTGFPVYGGQLTPQGMRQRYLLGQLNRQKYVDQYELLSSKDEIYVQTTSYDRTFQSAFSELMGLFPPGSLAESELLTQTQLNGLNTNGRGMPPMSIRNANSINVELGRNPLPNGFVSVPVFNFQNAAIIDDINMGGCSYVNKVDSYTFPADSTYTSVEYLVSDLSGPIGTAFGLTQQEQQEMTFMDLYDYCDIIQCREFQQVPLNYTYNADQLSEINQTVLATLMLPLENPILSRNMYVSKQIRSFLDKAIQIIYPQAVTAEASEIKYVLFSAHDWTVSQHLLFLDAANGNFTNLPFASQVNYELHSTDSCTDASCFWVEVYYNNVV